MRKEPYTLGSIVHVVKRGARGMDIIKTDSDKYRFLTLLYFLNDSNHPEQWERDVQEIKKGLHFSRPLNWSKREPVVNILSYCLMPNHFHLLLEEIHEGGISKFMQSLCGSMSVHFNRKYGEKGSLFQGAFKSKTVNTDQYLDLVDVYINIKNPFELYKGGLKKAIKDFEQAYKWAGEYQFCSLGDFSGRRDCSLILSRHELLNKTPAQYKNNARNLLLNKLEMLKSYESA